MFYLKEVFSDDQPDEKWQKIADFIVPPEQNGQAIIKRYTKEGVYFEETRHKQENGIKEVSVPEDYKPTFFPYFRPIKDQIHRIIVSGRSGSGKSWTVGMMLDQMTKTFPKHQIIIISFVDSDEALDRPRNGDVPIRLDLKRDDLVYYTEPEDFANSIVVFDDVEKGVDKKMVKHLMALRAMMFEVSRHYNTHIISISHDLLGGTLNKTVKAEATGCFLFPQHNQPHQTAEYLRRYVGLNKAQIADVMDTPSRWVYLSLIAPSYYITDRKVKMLV